MPRRGENIYKRKDGRWEGRFKFDNVTGKYKYVYAPTYRQVKEKLYELKTRKTPANDQKKSMSDLCNIWLDYKRHYIKESTYVKYNNIIESHIKPFIGKFYINELSEYDLQKYVLHLTSHGRLSGGGLSNKTVKDILTVLSSIFRYSKNAGFCCNNFHIEKFYPKAEKKQIKVLTSKDRIDLERYLSKSDNPMKIGILLALYSGMRIGELCALKWDHIDLDAGIISVNQTLQRLQDIDNKGKTKILISEPKSQSSKRIVPIPYFMIEILKKVKPKDNDTFFLTGNRSFTEPKNLENIFKRCLKECNIQKTNFHTLRHTFATRCVETGFDIKSLSEILGHSNVSTTLNLYAHPTIEHKKNNMDKLVLFK